MGLLKKAIDHLSDEAHYAASIFLARTGLLAHLPSFKMALNLLEYAGGDRREMDYALLKSRDFGRSFVISWKTLSRRIEGKARAALAGDHIHPARSLFYRAALYALVADWAARDYREHIENYEIAMAAFDEFRHLSTPGIEKVSFSVGGGVTKAHFRRPIETTSWSPAILFICGYDVPKEWLSRFEEEALRKGCATLSVDLPGCGEGYLYGSRLSGWRDFEVFTSEILAFLDSRGFSPASTGALGIGTGGLFAHLLPAAGLPVGAGASLGAPYDLSENFMQLAGVRRAEAFQWTGAGDPEEARTIIKDLHLEEKLNQVCEPTLIVHGMRDEVVSSNQARALVSAFSGNAELKLVPGGDHFCSGQLDNFVAPYIFKWFTSRLGREFQPISPR